MPGYDDNDDNENWSESSSYNEEDFFTESEDKIYEKEDDEEMPQIQKSKTRKKKSDASNVPIVGNVKWTKSGFIKPNFTINLEEPQCLQPSDLLGHEVKYF